MTNEWIRSMLISFVIILLFWNFLIESTIKYVGLFELFILLSIIVLWTIILWPKIQYFKDNFSGFSKDILVIIGASFFLTLLYLFTNAIESQEITIFWTRWIKHITECSIDILSLVIIWSCLTILPLLLLLVQIPSKHKPLVKTLAENE